MQGKTVLNIYHNKLPGCHDVPSRSSDDGDDELEPSCLDDISSEVVEDEPYFLNERGREALASIRNKIGLEVTRDWLHCQKVKLPPLELLCFLHRAGLLRITTFLYFKPEFCAEMSSQLIEMMTKDLGSVEDEKVALDIVRTLLSWMINVGNQTLRELFSLSSALMESFTSALMEALFTEKCELKMNFLNLLCGESESVVFDEGIRSFSSFILSSLLVYDASSVSLESSIGFHNKQWTSQYIPNKFKSLYEQLEELLGKEAVMREVELAIHDGKVNLKHMLYVVALISHHSDYVKGCADKWFKEALAERDEQRLGLALLVNRHHFAEVSKYLVGYVNWFGSIQTKNALTLNFLFEFLSKLVPYEPAVFLKIQVTKVPSGLPSCQGVISDYVSLAKTRLSDMNQGYDYISLFNDFHETLEEQQESDVMRVVKHFKENGEISKAVLEACVFRKQYYDKVFLPCLLSKPRGFDETRDALIIKLNTIGKIQSSLYRAWSRSIIS